MEHITAKVSCFARAYHYRNHPTRVFADAAAERLLGPEYERIAQSMAQGAGFFLPGFTGSAEEALRRIADGQLGPSVLARSAYCERMLANERRLGCRQYVVFAAGYDTFAMRERGAALTVYELDLPEVLADKAAKAEAAGLVSCAVAVPCDLAEPSWPEKLAASGFRRGEKAFAGLLGISYYLTRDEFRALLTAWGALTGEGSAVCFDYPSTEEGREAETNRALALDANERMKARYDEAELEALLAECGFLLYEHLDHEEMTAQYFAAHNASSPARRMEAPKGVGYVLAVRKGV